jgi:hypothetical protein
MGVEGMTHVCDERCVCPIHGTDLIYWPAGDDHACQDQDCVFGRGNYAQMLTSWIDRAVRK